MPLGTVAPGAIYSFSRDYPAQNPMTVKDKLHIGCSGWGYDDWLGGFYPESALDSESTILHTETLNTVKRRFPSPIRFLA